MKKNTQAFLFVLLCVFSLQIQAQDFTQNIETHIIQLLENDKLLADDANWEITDQNVSSISGVTHIYFRQVVNGFQVFGTESDIHILPNGKTLTVNNRFVKNSSSKTRGSSTPSLTAIQAVTFAANQLNYTITESLSVLEIKIGRSQETIISTGGISLSNIPAKLLYRFTDNNELVLVWDLSIQEISQHDWWNVRIDASTGIIIDKNNWMVSCSSGHDHSIHEDINYNKNLFDIPNYKNVSNTSEAGCVECYEVFALPLESPFYGSRTIEIDAANGAASPFGWHDTNGVSGAEFTVTRGNNVNAYEDGDNPGYQPNGGASLDFTGYPFSMVYTGADQYEDAAITNLFYWNNVIHDVLFQYGLDEAGGNFQELNYSGDGLGSDSVNAEAQDGSGTCNANFGTPPDGGNPRMQMYVCGNRDGDYDNMVVIHEYGHGISNRLTGGPSNTSCLFNTEQMGEGWSDWYGAMLTIEPGDAGTDSRGVGTYLFGDGPDGDGIRPFPYSTDTNINPQTYADISGVSIPHGVGSVWATMLWEVTWGLIDEYGFDPDIYNYTGDISLDAGNIIAMALITEGMKLQPCGPGFVDGRDAIFAADLALYGGANECILWDAFAKRGLGISADQGSSNSVTDGTEAFDTPSGEASFTAPEDVCGNVEVLVDLGGGSPVGGVYSGPGVTDNGDGTYSFDPAAAGIGVHTISYEVLAGTCSIASIATDTIEVFLVPNGPLTVGVSDFCVGDEVTVTATLVDAGNVIRWFDAPTGGSFLFEGTDYAFTPTGTTNVYAQENPPGTLSQLVISEITLETPDRFEIQNVGVETDYTGYTVAVSEEPFSNINTINSVMRPLGVIGENSVVSWNDDGGATYWGSNIWWDNDPGEIGWIIIIDGDGNVVDSAFWNVSEAQIATLNVTINGFNITGADLDWTGPGADLTAICGDSFRRNGDTNSAADWSGLCEESDYGVANSDIGIGFDGCLADRTLTEVTAETINPEIDCPDDITVTVGSAGLYTIPDYTSLGIATDNCAVESIQQSPTIGATVGEGVTIITLTAIDTAGNEATCTFNLTVDVDLGVEDLELISDIILYPNPTTGSLQLLNNSTHELIAVSIIDVNGRLIKIFDISNTSVETTLSLENIANGLYFVKIETEDSSIVKRIIKQ